MNVTCLTANLGTQHGVQHDAVHTLQALEHLFAASLTTHTKKKARTITLPALIQDVHGVATRYKLQPICTAHDAKLFVGAYQEALTTTNLTKPWTDRKWNTLQETVGGTTLVIASSDSRFIPQLLPAKPPPQLQSRCAALAIGTSTQTGTDTRTSERPGVRAVFVSYHGPRSMQAGERAEHVLCLCAWAGELCRKHGAPVHVLGDFNVAWSACARLLPDLPAVRLRLLPAVPHRRLTLDDGCPHADTIDYVLHAAPADGPAPPPVTGDSFDLADPCRHAVSGMRGALPSGFFDHDAIVYSLSLSLQ